MILDLAVSSDPGPADVASGDASSRRATCPTVYILDDDADVRTSLEWSAQRAGFRTRSFASPRECLEQLDSSSAGCLILDLRLPSMDGLELQRQLRKQNCFLPFIVISGHADLPAAVDAMKQGAVDFFEKPCAWKQLSHAIRTALERDQRNREIRDEEQRVGHLLSTLTPREREIFERVANGLTTKRIAAELELAVKAVDAHRSRLMAKLGVESVSQIAKLLAIDFRRKNREPGPP